jgi:hypothetical protein
MSDDCLKLMLLLCRVQHAHMHAELLTSKCCICRKLRLQHKSRSVVSGKLADTASGLLTTAAMSSMHILRAAHAVRHPAVLGAYDHWAQALRRCGSSLAPAVPGTVQAYDQNLLVEPVGMAPADWPKTVERTPAILAAFSALAKHKEDITGEICDRT